MDFQQTEKNYEYDCPWGVAASGMSRGVEGKLSDSECDKKNSFSWWKNMRFSDSQSCSDKI